MMRCFHLLAALVLGFATVVFGPAQDKGVSTMQPYLLQAVLRPDQPRVGEPLELDIVLVNQSNTTVHIGQRSLVFDWRYDLTDQNGSPVARTRYGEEGQRSAEAGTAGAVLLALAPRGQLKAKISLHEIFELTKAGKYRLVVSRTLPNPDTGTAIEVRSAPIEFALR
jgi:hypothetical protein